MAHANRARRRTCPHPSLRRGEPGRRQRRRTDRLQFLGRVDVERPEDHLLELGSAEGDHLPAEHLQRQSTRTSRSRVSTSRAPTTSTAKEVSAIKSNSEPNVVIGQDPSSLPLLAQSGKVVDLTRRPQARDRRAVPGHPIRALLQGQATRPRPRRSRRLRPVLQQGRLQGRGHHQAAGLLDRAGSRRDQAHRPGQAPLRHLHPARRRRVDQLRVGGAVVGQRREVPQ